jgi:SagB-type dehydrogenase family enzyme
MTLEEALFNRRSTRGFKDAPLSLEAVSQLLWAGGGKNADAVTGPSRTAPSAGGIYPIEIYIVAGEVNGLSAGIYRYSWQDHTLIPVKKGDYRSHLARAALFQTFISRAPAVIVLTGQFSKTERKYGTRGVERYVPMDAGHTAGNISLQATALQLGVVTVGAFNDSAVKKVLDLKYEEPLYILPVGLIFSD